MMPPSAQATQPASVSGGVIADREWVMDGALNINKVGERLILPLGTKNTVAFQGGLLQGTWTTAVLTVKVSCHPHHTRWEVHPTGTYVLNNSNKITIPIEVDGFLWACCEVTTAEGSDAIAEIIGSASRAFM